MNWHIVLILFGYLTIFWIETNQASQISCSENQRCIYYRKCKPAVKIFAKILASSNSEEKENLTEEFKGLRCGNFSDEKTVCCSQDQIQSPKPSK